MCCNYPVNSALPWISKMLLREATASPRYTQLLYKCLEEKSPKRNFYKLHHETPPPNGCKNYFTPPCSAELILIEGILNV